MLSRFLAKFENEFFEHGFLNTEKAINKVLKKRVQNYVIVLFPWAEKCKWEIKKTKPVSIHLIT